MFLQKLIKTRPLFALIATLTIGAGALITSAQQTRRAATFDVNGYVIDAKLLTDENKLDATVDVTFVPLEDLRSVAFELNGSLKIDSIVRVNSAAQPTPAPTPTRGRQPRPTPTPRGPEVTFVQDQVGVSDLGPSVRIDLGEQVTKDTPVTLRFKYNGVLNTPSGGPLLNKRLAYIGEVNGYLFYAARWFPFHDYAADRATADITVTLPGAFQVVGHSDTDVPAVSAGKYRFIQSRPGLVGNIAYGRYTNRDLQIGGYELKFYTRPGSTENVEAYAETIGKALEYYTKQFGEPEMGRDLAIVQIDDESLDFYSGAGITFVSDRQFTEPRNVTEERLQREAAYQWWGHTVGLKSFDDAWVSQGLAEYSAFAFRESNATGAQLDALRRELVEKSLTFEQTASLLRAPANLDDQSTAYRYMMYGKGAMVFKLLRETLGKQKFDQLLKTYLEEFRGKSSSIDEFERLTSRVAGQNMRYFFARWVESTGVPEFTADYVILRNRAGKFIARGTVKQNYDNLRLPVEIQLKFEGENGFKTEQLQIDDASADFNIEVDGKPLEVIVDPGFKLLWVSPELRVTSIARRGIELFKEGNYSEAQTQLENALKLDRSNSWIYYHLGLLFLEQRNYELAKENFRAALLGNINPPWLAVWAEIKLGNAYDAQGDRTRAIAAYDRAEKTGIEYDNAPDAIARFKATPYDPRAGDVN
ncbi:MAG: tetratricopeptide repeat protein [Acidobacteria bacterium]|nr:tetratricopeptide repeat protein [Acidobacteriota bacterium]